MAETGEAPLGDLFKTAIKHTCGEIEWALRIINKIVDGLVPTELIENSSAATWESPDDVTLTLFQWEEENRDVSADFYGSFAVFMKNVRGDMDEAERLYGAAEKADPAHANNLGNFALCMKNVRKDMDEAERLYRAVKKADPTNADNLGRFAYFMQDVRKDIDEAERLFRAAEKADPADANNLANFSVFLFFLGQDVEAATLLERAEGADDKQSELALELAFYRYAHIAPHELSSLKAMLLAGTRADDFDMTTNVETARSVGHPYPELLMAIAECIRDCGEINQLSSLEGWEESDMP
jgi:tetratricopeptide (TPR) repeat protein